MSTATVLSVLAFVLISNVQQTKAQSGIICVSRQGGNVQEDMGPVIFQLTRKQGSSGSVTVSYTITDVTTEPEDIAGSRTGSVTFLDGVTEAEVEVAIVDDELQEDAEQFTITLTGPIGPESQAAAVIFDNDIFSNWVEWSAGVGPCSTTCGPGTRTETRTRTCIAVMTQRCIQPLTETRTVGCNSGACATITQWSEWADNGACSTTCGSGSQMQSRTRTCTGSCPADFSSMETRTVTCMICTCPVIGPWSTWADSGQCTVTCGGGTKIQARTRYCTNTCTPSDCTKREERPVTCNVYRCASTGAWTGYRRTWGWSGNSWGR